MGIKVIPPVREDFNADRDLLVALFYAYERICELRKELGYPQERLAAYLYCPYCDTQLEAHEENCGLDNDPEDAFMIVACPKCAPCKACKDYIYEKHPRSAVPGSDNCALHRYTCQICGCESDEHGQEFVWMEYKCEHCGMKMSDLLTCDSKTRPTLVKLHENPETKCFLCGEQVTVQIKKD